jgi:hypothetical protein
MIQAQPHPPKEHVMKTLALTLFAIVVLGAGPAAAQVNPNPDGIGMYADREATTSCITAEINEPIEVYLILTRPSVTEDILGWECRIDAPDNAVIWGWALPPETGGGLFFIEPPYYQAAFGHASQPPIDIVVLMTFIVRVIDAEPAVFYIREHWQDSGDFGLPTYAFNLNDIDLHPMVPWPSGEYRPAFAINNATGTATEVSTWGTVKALYR